MASGISNPSRSGFIQAAALKTLLTRSSSFICFSGLAKGASRAIGKEARPERSHEGFCCAFLLRYRCSRGRCRRDAEQALTWSFVRLLGSLAPAQRFVTGSAAISSSAGEGVRTRTDISLLWTGDVPMTSSPGREHCTHLPAHCAILHVYYCI